MLKNIITACTRLHDSDPQNWKNLPTVGGGTHPGGGGGHSRVLVVRGRAALTTPFFRPRFPFSIDTTHNTRNSAQKTPVTKHLRSHCLSKLVEVVARDCSSRSPGLKTPEN